MGYEFGFSGFGISIWIFGIWDWDSGYEFRISGFGIGIRDINLDFRNLRWGFGNKIKEFGIVTGIWDSGVNFAEV